MQECKPYSSTNSNQRLRVEASKCAGMMPQVQYYLRCNMLYQVG